MDNEIVIKIKKLLALSKSSNEYESRNAILMAQKLLMKYKLTLKEVEEFQDNNFEIREQRTGIKIRISKWKNALGNVVANNFGCYMFVRSGRTHEICFYGKDEDVLICKIIMEYAIKCINSNGDKLIKKLKQDKRRKYFKGIKDDYALGFVHGLKERFEEQIKSNKEWGLVIAKDPIVIDSYKEFSASFSTINLNPKFNKNMKVYNNGVEDGRKFDISNKIENEGVAEDCNYIT